MKLGWVIGCLLAILSVDAIGQCKGFTRKKCLPNLAPYISSGQVNSTVLFEGDSASLKLTFYSEQDYRLLVCAQQIFEEGAYFKVRDMDKKVLYDSSEGDDRNIWDFQVHSTQDLWIDVFAPEPEDNTIEIANSACISLAIGMNVR